MMKEDEAAIDRFCEYLRIKSVHPNPDYAGCVAFLQRQAAEIGLQCEVVEPVAGRPIVMMTWTGSDPNLPSLLLNSHTDVVPVFEEHWKYDAFAGVRDEEGRVFGRGTQDMKSVGVQYLEAIRRLKAAKFSPLRTIHLTYVPDEEIGGLDGMAAFLLSDEWTRMNVGCALDEGLANPGDEMTLFYGERHTWKVEVTCAGNTGHGSRFIADSAGEKLRSVLDQFYDYRREQERLLLQQLKENGCVLTLGDVTTVNLTIIQGGVQSNVVPDKFRACFDCRIAQQCSPQQFEQLVASWCHQAGPGVTFRLLQREDNPNNSCISVEKSCWWAAFQSCCENMGIKLQKEIFPAGTDSRFLRRLGIPCYGFSPMNNTPILLHDHNEFLSERVFLRGIEVYQQLITALSNVVDS